MFELLPDLVTDDGAAPFQVLSGLSARDLAGFSGAAKRGKNLSTELVKAAPQVRRAA